MYDLLPGRLDEPDLAGGVPQDLGPGPRHGGSACALGVVGLVGLVVGGAGR